MGFSAYDVLLAHDTNSSSCTSHTNMPSQLTRAKKNSHLQRQVTTLA